MANNKPRVTIPRNPELLLNLAAKVYAKHAAQVAASPLNTLKNHTWTTNGPQVAAAIALHNQAEDYKRLTEETYRKRDLLVAEIEESLKSSRDLLLSIHRDNPKELGQWGFEVDDTPRAQRKKQSIEG